MKIARKRSEPVKETQMVSLADIAFLIIFFFLLSSTFMSDRESVALPTLPTKTGDTQAAIIVRMDDSDAIFLNGEAQRDSSDLEAHLHEILANRTTPEQCEVRFLCDKTRTFKNYRPVYEAIANAGGIIAIQHELPR